MKRPAFQFYPADWRKDAALQSCSIAARGLWLECMNLMHECEPYGHLIVNGKPMTGAQIARLVGVSDREYKPLMKELFDAGVPSITENGAIYSRRMVRDEEIRTKRAEGGKAGSEHGGKGAEYGQLGGRPKHERGDKKPPLDAPLKPPPSSSSSSSSSSSERKASSNPSDTARDPPAMGLAEEFCYELGINLTADTRRISWPGQLAKWKENGGNPDDLMKAARICKLRSEAPKPLNYYLKIADEEAKKRIADETVTPEETRKTTLDLLKCYAETGYWIKNLSGNGVWVDAFNVGPPPHDPRTKISEELLASVKGARERRDSLMNVSVKQFRTPAA